MSETAIDVEQLVKRYGSTTAVDSVSFAVRAGEKGTGVLVTQGTVEVPGVDEPLQAGQQLEPDVTKPATAPRATHALEWTRELVAEIAGTSDRTAQDVITVHEHDPGLYADPARRAESEQRRQPDPAGAPRRAAAGRAAAAGRPVRAGLR